jgi:hypothetical protein
MKIDLRSTGCKVKEANAITKSYEIKLLYNIYAASMKIVFAFFFCMYSLKVYSHIVLTGTGRGAVAQTDMKGLHPGDILAIRPGLYEKGGSF